jgi:hypothetical protein
MTFGNVALYARIAETGICDDLPTATFNLQLTLQETRGHQRDAVVFGMEREVEVLVPGGIRAG